MKKMEDMKSTAIQVGEEVTEASSHIFKAMRLVGDIVQKYPEDKKHWEETGDLIIKAFDAIEDARMNAVKLNK